MRTKLLLLGLLSITLAGYSARAEDGANRSRPDSSQLTGLPSSVDADLLDSMVGIPVTLTRVTIEDPALAAYSYERLRPEKATNLRVEMAAVPQSLTEHRMKIFESLDRRLGRLYGYSSVGVSSAMRKEDRLVFFFGLNKDIDTMAGGLFFLIDENGSQSYDPGEAFAFIEGDRVGQLFQGVEMTLYVPKDMGIIPVSDIPVPALTEEEQDRLSRDHDARLVGQWFRTGWESSSHRFYPSLTSWYSYVDEDGTSRFVDGTNRSERWAYLRTGAYYFDGEILYIDYDDDEEGYLPHRRYFSRTKQ